MAHLRDDPERLRPVLEACPVPISMCRFDGAVLYESPATLALFGFAMLYLFNPMAASGANGLDPVGEYGLTNMRTLAAPLLAMAVMAGIGTVKKNFVFVAPAALYFLFTALIRVFHRSVGSGIIAALRSGSGWLRQLAACVARAIPSQGLGLRA